MAKRRFSLTFFLLICLSLPLTATAQTVDIPDPNLRAAIESVLGKASGATITRADMETFTIADLRNSNIRDLTGLEHATNLTILDLGAQRVQGVWTNSNSIHDISPLAGLSELTELWLDRNEISDISRLEGLNNLEVLWLSHNEISNISPLAGLNNLTQLSLWNNSISDISSLEGLNNLKWLILDDNSISDISSLSGLTNLEYLTLANNSISDISPLVANTGLGTGDAVVVSENPLNAASINTHIPALQRRGVTVEFDAVVTGGVNIPDDNLRAAITTTLGKASGTAITTADMANLTPSRSAK